MAEILFSFDMCVRVCAQRTGHSDKFKTVKAVEFKFDMHVPREKGAWPGSHDPLIFWALNDSSSKMVKAADFKFDVHDMTP